MRTFKHIYLDEDNEREIELEISYYISHYLPANWDYPAEGGEIEDCEVKVLLIDGAEPCHSESIQTLVEIESKEFYELIEELCWEDHEKIGKQYEEDLAEYKWEIRNDR
jgi:hypothetical protein